MELANWALLNLACNVAYCSCRASRVAVVLFNSSSVSANLVVNKRYNLVGMVVVGLLVDLIVVCFDRCSCFKDLNMTTPL